MTLGLFGNGGYHLNRFQLLNWGVFNGKAYTVRCDGKSSLLTGENGSGKTTIVDALLTLLVPPQQRYYNLSSETDKKKARTEESYVLGAYSTMQNEENALITAKKLRKKNEVLSILNGIFEDTERACFVSLLQVRYFSADNLQRVFAVTRKELDVETILKTLEQNDVKIESGSKWKQSLSKTFDSVFYDNFAQYCNNYSGLFGFRSDKALRLFSQIVGLKVLGNLSEFMRNNMLEDLHGEEKFQKLNKNYNTLIQIDRTIRKTQKQMEMLENLLESGKKYTDEKTTKERLELLLSAVDVWYAQTAVLLITKNSVEQNKQLAAIQHEIELCISEIGRCVSELDSLKIAINQNEIMIRITEIRHQIELLTGERNLKQKTFNEYRMLLEMVKTAESRMSVPSDASVFAANARQFESLLKKETENAQQLEDRKLAVRTGINQIKEALHTVTEELESLGARTTNIPFDYIKRRQSICNALNIREDDLPYAGELLQILPAEKEWEYAIEKLLHNFALTLLVPESLYPGVTRYIKDTDMNARIVYLKTENTTLCTQAVPEKDTLPAKIEIKQNSALTDWLTNHMVSRFNYLCTNDVDIFRRVEKALTTSGLIKSGIRHEKDDRKQKGFASVQKLLGWENKEKRTMLSIQYDECRSVLKDKVKQLENISSQQSGNQNSTRCVEKLLDIQGWDEIDVASVAFKIDALIGEQTQLKENSAVIRDLQKKLDLKEQENRQLETVKTDLIEKSGRIKNELEKLGKDLADNQKTLQASIIPEEERSERIKLLMEERPHLTKPDTLEKLTPNRDKIQGDLRSQISGSTSKITGHITAVSNQMRTILIPSPSIQQQYGDWAADFTDMNDSIDALPDFESKYAHLKTDDLPKYKEEFRKYLHNTLKNEIGDFTEFLNSWEQEIKKAVIALNSSLKSITYNKNPDTFIQLELNPVNDMRVTEFRKLLRAATPDALILESTTANEERRLELFEHIKELLELLNRNDLLRNFVLDIRNRYAFVARELYTDTDETHRLYENTSSLSGGEKSKLTYTILASAVAYQFSLTSYERTNGPFRFVILDEAFTKSDFTNSDYAMQLFKQLDFQLMVVTPQDKVNIVEDYIASIHLTEKEGNESRLLEMSIKEYKDSKNQIRTAVQ